MVMRKRTSRVSLNVKKSSGPAASNGFEIFNQYSFHLAHKFVSYATPIYFFGLIQTQLNEIILPPYPEVIFGTFASPVGGVFWL